MTAVSQEQFAGEGWKVLRTLVVKDGVHLGGLTEVQRAWALGVAACSLRLGEGVTEAQANARLKACLGAEGAFLDTDHVELRRWLVDTGWWMRDGYGHRYERVPPQALPESLRPLAEALGSVELSAWVAAQREAVQAERARRRQAWAAKEATGKAVPSTPDVST